MKKLIFIMLLIQMSLMGFAQTVFWSDSFEVDNKNTWYYTLQQSGLNKMMFSILGLGTNTIEGIKSAGVICTNDGGTNWYQGYMNMASDIRLFVDIDASNYQNLVLAFNWKCLGDYGYDYGMVGYSLDNGANIVWINVGGYYNGQYCNSSSVQPMALNFNSVLNNKKFRLYFRWICDSYSLYNPAFIVDCVTFTGTATSVPPVADFYATYTTFEAGDSTQFIDNSSNNPTSWAWSFPGGKPTTSTAQNPWVKYNTAGTYNATLTVTNAYGNNQKVRTNYITVEAPTAITQISPSKVLKGQTYTLTIIGNKTDFNLYSNTVWFSNGTDFMYTTNPVAINSTQLTVQLAVSSTAVLGKYDAHVQNSTIGELVFNDGIEVVNKLGINDNTSNNIFTIYPNPAYQSITINLPADFDIRSKVNIYNYLGKFIKEVYIKGNNYMDISDLQNGIYFLKFQDDNYNCFVKMQKL
jgi:PKD repeat protein